jgi:G3E family GTPase
LRLRYKVFIPGINARAFLPRLRSISMRTVLFTGLSGSGKSVALLALASFLKEREAPLKRLAVVETEEGATDVIRELSGDPAFRTVDLTRGCIGCTSLTAGLGNALESMRAGPVPSWLLIEASCLGYQTIKDIVAQSLPAEARPFTVLVIETGGWASLREEAPLLADGMMTAADLVIVNDFGSLTPATLSALAAELSDANPACLLQAARVPEMDPGEAFKPLLSEPGNEIETGAAA